MHTQQSSDLPFSPAQQNHASLDTGDKTVQCGRKTDQVKIWMMWKAHGDLGLAQRVDECVGLIEHMAAQMKVGGNGHCYLMCLGGNGYSCLRCLGMNGPRYLM